MNVWIDIAVMASLFAVGNILFGHFEERTPKWRRVLIIHGWWLPTKGINGLTGEPKEKYYALRGWTL